MDRLDNAGAPMMLPNFAATWLDNIVGPFGYCVYGRGVAGLPWWHPSQYFLFQICFQKMPPGQKRFTRLKPHDPSKPFEAGIVVERKDGSIASYRDL